MSAAVITSLAPINVGGTVLPTSSLKVSPAVASQMYKTSGLLFPSVQATLGAAPMVTFEATLLEAYNTIGFTGTLVTTFSTFLSSFSSAIKATTGPSYTLAASAKAFVYITGIRVGQNGIAMASCSAMLLSSDGITHPLTGSSGSIPTLGSQPALKTLGPCSVNGTAIAGTTSVSVDLAPSVEPELSDGDLYPRACAFIGGSPVINVEHSDPSTLRTALGFLGVPVSGNFVQYFRDVDSTSQTTAATGVSLTVATGRCIPIDFGADNQAIAKGGMRVECLSSNATHPIVVATGASVPTP